MEEGEERGGREGVNRVLRTVGGGGTRRGVIVRRLGLVFYAETRMTSILFAHFELTRMSEVGDRRSEIDWRSEVGDKRCTGKQLAGQLNHTMRRRSS